MDWSRRRLRSGDFYPRFRRFGKMPGVFTVTIPVPTVIISVFAVAAVVLIVKVILSFVRGK